VDALAIRWYGGSTEYYYQHDANYNVTAIANTSGTVLERYAYTPYGEVTVLDADFDVDSNGLTDVENTHFYTGRERDAETGLQLNGERFYAPHLGRWMSRDPIEYEGGPNLYSYVSEQPTTFVDPFGLEKACLSKLVDDSTRLDKQFNKTWRQFVVVRGSVNVTDSGWYGTARGGAAAYYIATHLASQTTTFFAGDILCTCKDDDGCCEDSSECIATVARSGGAPYSDGILSLAVKADAQSNNNVVTAEFGATAGYGGTNQIAAGGGPAGGQLAFPGGGITATAEFGNATWRCECGEPPTPVAPSPSPPPPTFDPPISYPPAPPSWFPGWPPIRS
jgi:RHS repeat-associated protein